MLPDEKPCMESMMDKSIRADQRDPIPYRLIKFMHEKVYSGLNAVKSRLHHVTKRILSQRRRNEVKQWLISMRKEWAPLYVLLHGRYTARELVGEIRARVKDDFDFLMVHSANDRLLPMYSGKAQDIIQELMDFCGRNRTLVMPALLLGCRS